MSRRGPGAMACFPTARSPGFAGVADLVTRRFEEIGIGGDVVGKQACLSAGFPKLPDVLSRQEGGS